MQAPAHKIHAMNSSAEKLKVSDIAPTTLRLPPDVRDALLRQATLNGRSLSQEITVRLRDSLAGHAPRAQVQADGGAAGEPTDMHRMLISVFDTLAPDKQLALLTLLRR